MAIFPNRYLVIDCGSRHIKGLLVEEALGSRKILRAEMLPAVSMRETAEADSAEEADGLREDYEYNLVRFIQSFFPEENAFILSMPLNKTYVRDIAIPVINPSQALEILPNEVENRLPISLEEAEVIGEYWKSDEEASHFISYTAPLDEIQGSVEPLIRSGGNVRMLTVPTAALASAIRILPEHLYLNRILGQAEIGFQDTIVNILDSGMVCFTRSVPVGLAQLLDSISEITGFDLEKTESFLRDLRADVSESRAGGYDEAVLAMYRLKKDDAKKILKKIKDFYTEVAGELERTMLSAPVPAPESIYISGGGATLPGCDDFLETRLGIPVGLYPLQLETDNIAPWVMSIGMMEHFSKKARERIDFLSTPFGSTLKRGELRLSAFATPIYIGSAALVVLLLSFMVGIFLDRKQKFAYVGQQRTLAQSIVPGFNAQTMQPVDAVRSICRERLALAQNRYGGNRSLDLLKEITDKMPGRAEVRSKLRSFQLRYMRSGKNQPSQLEIELQMELDEATDIAVVQKALRESKMFSDVKEKGSNDLAGQKVKVTFQIRVAGNETGMGAMCN